MAGGKLTPRQKMINLMYLVFIAMLALNMSKEVLSAFGLMNEQFESSNVNADKTNDQMHLAITAKAAENPSFAAAKEVSDKVKGISETFYNYVGGLKGDITKDIELDEGKLPYEAMDKGDKIDEQWFAGDGYSPKGNAIIAAIEKYKTDMKAALGKDVKYKSVAAELDEKFSTADVVDGEGVKKKYLDYHYKGFPSIASLTKLSAMQNNIQVIEASIYNIALGKAALEATSMNKYTAIVVLDKNAYFQGEKVTGKVVLGRYDSNTKPTSFQGPGKIDPASGQALIDMTAGAVGEQKIAGSFTFLEDGKTVPLPFTASYVVVPRPNSANISADKMNVVYRGLPNPMTISFAGIADNAVTASAPGLSKAGGKAGAYNLVPGSGNELTVTASGKLPDGTTVSDKKMFRIKNIPGPNGAIAGQTGTVTGQKSRLEVSQVSAKLDDFAYDLDFQVTQFAFKVPGQPTIIVNGDRVNAQCKAALARSGRGDQVVISDIKTRVVGVSGIIPPKTAPVIYEIQ